MANPILLDVYLGTMTEDGYVAFNADRRLGQNQYASRYINGKHGYPNLGEGLRFQNTDTGNYHDILIHKDDLKTFHERVESHISED